MAKTNIVESYSWLINTEALGWYLTTWDWDSTINVTRYTFKYFILLTFLYHTDRNTIPVGKYWIVYFIINTAGIKVVKYKYIESGKYWNKNTNKWF